MDTKNADDQQLDVNFESHPPIESDLDGITTLIRQTLLNFVDCSALANQLINQKEITQVIAIESPAEKEATDEDDEDDDEPDDDIYAVSSVLNLGPGDENSSDACKQLTKYLQEKSPECKKLFDLDSSKIGLIINERYINLPPQLALPTLKDLTQHIELAKFSHLIFISKILLRARSTETKLPSKKSKSSSSSSGDAEPIIFVNPEEEIVSELADSQIDIDVSKICDGNATWSFSSDIKYIPHRRILSLEKSKWPTLIANLEKELKL